MDACEKHYQQAVRSIDDATPSISPVTPPKVQPIDTNKKRPNPCRSYYLTFEYARNLLSILTRHPGRELKMTARLDHACVTNRRQAAALVSRCYRP
jgi:hypothetical protein